MSLVYKIPPVIVDRIGSVIDSMRDTATITASVEVSGVYTITSDNKLSNNDYITIDGNDYKVESVTANDFIINAATGLDFTGQTWKAKAPYYQHGHIREIVKVISEKDKSKVLKYQRYPLIILPQDFQESEGNMFTDASLDFIIINQTKPNYVAADRYANNLIPVLYPIWAKFKRALQVSKVVDIVDDEAFIDKMDHVFWGREGLYGNDANIFNDWVDAIEINNYDLRFKNICV